MTFKILKIQFEFLSILDFYKVSKKYSFVIVHSPISQLKVKTSAVLPDFQVKWGDKHVSRLLLELGKIFCYK